MAFNRISHSNHHHLVCSPWLLPNTNQVAAIHLPRGTQRPRRFGGRHSAEEYLRYRHRTTHYLLEERIQRYCEHWFILVRRQNSWCKRLTEGLLCRSVLFNPQLPVRTLSVQGGNAKMNHEQHIKNEIRRKLHELPRVQIFCMVCRKLLCTITTQRELICWDCWVERRQPRKYLFGNSQ